MSDADRIAALEAKVRELTAQLHHWAGLAAGAASSASDYRMLDALERAEYVAIHNGLPEPLNWSCSIAGQAAITGPTFRSVVQAALHLSRT